VGLVCGRPAGRYLAQGWVYLEAGLQAFLLWMACRLFLRGWLTSIVLSGGRLAGGLLRNTREGCPFCKG
jgi:hypothetical protein